MPYANHTHLNTTTKVLLGSDFYTEHSVAKKTSHTFGLEHLGSLNIILQHDQTICIDYQTFT